MTDDEFDKEVKEFRQLSCQNSEALRIIEGMSAPDVFERLPLSDSQRLMENVEWWQGFATALDWMGKNERMAEISLVSWRERLEIAGVLKKEERLKG